MTDVFISYKREERAKAKAIAEALVGRGYSLWWDVELLPGDKFGDEIVHIIDQAKAAIVLWSKASVGSDFVLGEADIARERGILVPAFLEKCKLPIPMRPYHTHDLSKWNGEPDDDALLPLIQAIEAKVSPSGKAAKGSEEKEAALHLSDAEVQFWREVSTSKVQSEQEYLAYLNQFGEAALFADLARIRIERIQKAQVDNRTSVSATEIDAGGKDKERPPIRKKSWWLATAAIVAAGGVLLWWLSDSKIDCSSPKTVEEFNYCAKLQS